MRTMSQVFATPPIAPESPVRIKSPVAQVSLIPPPPPGPDDFTRAQVASHPSSVAWRDSKGRTLADLRAAEYVAAYKATSEETRCLGTDARAPHIKSTTANSRPRGLLAVPSTSPSAAKRADGLQSLAAEQQLAIAEAFTRASAEYESAMSRYEASKSFAVHHAPAVLSVPRAPSGLASRAHTSQNAVGGTYDCDITNFRSSGHSSPSRRRRYHSTEEKIALQQARFHARKADEEESLRNTLVDDLQVQVSTLKKRTEVLQQRSEEAEWKQRALLAGAVAAEDAARRAEYGTLLRSDEGCSCWCRCRAHKEKNCHEVASASWHHRCCPHFHNRSCRARATQGLVAPAVFRFENVLPRTLEAFPGAGRALSSAAPAPSVSNSARASVTREVQNIHRRSDDGNSQTSSTKTPGPQRKNLSASSASSAVSAQRKTLYPVRCLPFCVLQKAALAFPTVAHQGLCCFMAIASHFLFSLLCMRRHRMRMI